MATYLTIKQALEQGWDRASDENGKMKLIKNMDELDIIDYPYIVVEGIIDDDGLQLCFES